MLFTTLKLLIKDGSAFQKVMPMWELVSRTGQLRDVYFFGKIFFLVTSELGKWCSPHQVSRSPPQKNRSSKINFFHGYVYKVLLQRLNHSRNNASFHVEFNPISHAKVMYNLVFWRSVAQKILSSINLIILVFLGQFPVKSVLLKGTVIRDFRPLVFSMYQTHIVLKLSS